MYRRPDGTYVHRDTLHRGKAAELELYNASGRHIGTCCPHCGVLKPNSAVPGRTL